MHPDRVLELVGHQRAPTTRQAAKRAQRPTGRPGHACWACGGWGTLLVVDLDGEVGWLCGGCLIEYRATLLAHRRDVLAIAAPNGDWREARAYVYRGCWWCRGLVPD